jgi:cyanophycinase
MAGDIALVGGNEFRTGCEGMDLEILRASGQDPARVLVIPTAAAWFTPEDSAAHGVSQFTSLGGDASPLMVLDRSQANDPRYSQALIGAGVIYFPGGSPDYLLETLQDSLLLQALRQAVENGTVLAGSSAGAMVLGSQMRRPQRGGWVKALDIVPGVAVLPHHEDRDPAETAQQLQGQVPSDLTVLGIDARTGCLGRPGRWRVVGVGRVVVYQAGKWASYSSGDILPAGV